MRIVILGGDGYLGWATAMHLSALGHQIVVADNYLRRDLMRRSDCDSLFPVGTLHQRASEWERVSGQIVDVVIGDLTEWEVLAGLFKGAPVDAVVHYAEQPSAPFSMADRRSATLTLTNNLMVTMNLIQAVREFSPNTHIVKLGTMGEYGTPNIDIEEGWIDITHKSRTDRFLFPRQAGSLYHTTKIMDTDLLWFYVRVWGLRVTDLMQGPVYGIQTDESLRGGDHFLPHFGYDEVFGTVINRFIVQAVVGVPLTVYGKGGQTRGYLDIRDTMQCVRLAVDNPALAGEMRIYNQFVETFSVNELAARVQEAGYAAGLDVQLQHLPNPRVEAEDHYYNPKHEALPSLGLQPHPLNTDELTGMIELVRRYQDRIDRDKIVRNVRWR
jgi:UDP-sulfoquinovose synthase